MFIYSNVPLNFSLSKKLFKTVLAKNKKWKNKQNQLSPKTLFLHLSCLRCSWWQIIMSPWLTCDFNFRSVRIQSFFTFQHLHLSYSSYSLLSISFSFCSCFLSFFLSVLFFLLLHTSFLFSCQFLNPFPVEETYFLHKKVSAKSKSISCSDMHERTLFPRIEVDVNFHNATLWIKSIYLFPLFFLLLSFKRFYLFFL